MTYLLVAPFVFYPLYLIGDRDAFWRHAVLFGAQALVAAYSLRNGVYDSTYLFLFFYSPQFALLIAHTYRNDNYRFTIGMFLAYSAVLTAFAGLSISMSQLDLGEAVRSFFSISTYTRTSEAGRYQFLNALNIGKNIFGLDERALEAVALTIYPLIFISFIFLKTSKLRWSEAIILFVAILFLLLKNSRGEVLFALALFGTYLIEKMKWKKIRPAYWLLVLFPFFQLLFSGRFLNGRTLLNEFFYSHISPFGYGMGFSKAQIFTITKGDHGSFHNIHFEAIVNFGLLFYCGLLTAILIAAYKLEFFRAKALLFLWVFLLLSTNYELFDLYVAVVCGFLGCCYFEAANKGDNASRQFKSV